MKAGFFAIPALNAEATLGQVITDLKAAWKRRAPDREMPPVLLVDDGSRDGTAAVARRCGAEVAVHERNLGKGAALRTALGWGQEHGYATVVSLDADGQHDADSAIELFFSEAPTDALLLGVRDLAGAKAPLPNRLSNRFSNFALSVMTGQWLADTQCGLRRYPVKASLALGPRDTGFAFEAEVIVLGLRKGLRIKEIPVGVHYPQGSARVTHFHSVRDPARIVRRVLQAMWRTSHHRTFRRYGERFLFLCAFLCTTLIALHALARYLGRVEAPSTVPPLGMRRDQAGIRWFGASHASRPHGIWEVFLEGRPEDIGFAHGKLLYESMVENEGVLYRALDRAIPSALFRTLVFDLASFGYRDMEPGFDEARRRELSAQALAFQPDPFADRFPTYQRFTYLAALYDISLSFETSPLIGCTTLIENEASPHLMARAFDFEVDPVFDADKAVFLVREEGKIPFLSVAWPGLVGVVSGMNAEGLAIVVHGARAGVPKSQGEAVVFELRRVLSHARTTREAITLLAQSSPMVSHLLILNDAQGDAIQVERIPDRTNFVHSLPSSAAVTNHLKGPGREDPKNRRVLETTSTRDRLERAEELLRLDTAPPSPHKMVTFLRDRSRPGGSPWPEGDRRAIDAHIATHGVVFDSSGKVAWVSQGPHLRGGFIAYPLATMLKAGYRPEQRPPLERIPEE